MPAHMVGLPVSSSNIKISRKGESYPLLLDTDTFDRAGEDGDIPIIPLAGGDEFVGEVLEGQWRKGWTSPAMNTFCATIDSGLLRLTGVANAAGVAGNGWINSHHIAPLLEDLEYTVSLLVPVDDTGAVADRDIRLAHFIKQDKDEFQPDVDDNFLQIEIDVDETGLIMYLRKEVNGVNTTLESGYDYTMDGTRNTEAGAGKGLRATIWRLVFNGKPGTAGATLSVYLKQSDTLANAETATEYQVTNSPFDISDLAFNVGYPAYRIYTQNTTYFGTTYDSANRATSGYLRVTYPSQFNINYNYTEADYGESDVELWDGDPAVATSQRVYDEDHEFSGNPYLQNGLIRTIVDNSLVGLILRFWDGATWIGVVSQGWGRLTTDVKDCKYAHLLRIVSLSPEKVVLRLRFKDSAIINEDYYIDADITFERGKPYYELNLLEAYPVQDVFWQYYHTGGQRFGYMGDGEIPDKDLALSATNGTMTDNFMLLFDDAGRLALTFMFTNEKPDAAFYSYQGDLARIQDIVAIDIASTKIWIGCSPFSLVANLFEEAEDGTLGGGAGTVTDAAASPLLGANNAVQLDAAGENVYWDFIAGTNLPAGRYLAVVRAREVDDEDMDVSVINDPLGVPSYRNEENAVVTFALGATFAYYGVFFDITDLDVTGTDLTRILVEKVDADADEIRIDYFLIVPCGDGMNFPQDLAHSALRGVSPRRRLCER